MLKHVSHHLTHTECCLPFSSLLASPDAISLQQALHESVFSPGISASPPHRVALCWDKHCQLLPEVLGLTAKRVATWSAEEVRHAYTLTLRQHIKSRHAAHSLIQHEGISCYSGKLPLCMNIQGKRFWFCIGALFLPVSSVKTYKAL